MALLNDLQTIVGEDRASTTASHREHHSHDASSHTPVLPDVVIWPETTAEVSAIVRYANERRIPLVGWGAGTSIEGNPIPSAGGIVVDFSRMDRILDLHAADFQVTVQPGILYKNMNETLARSGLFFAPDPGANASIGGMVANNAAGIRTVKYGATRDNVLALEVVLASGEVIRTGSRSVKQSAGYDLTHLIVGSEGTLGLVTEATLKLAPLPEHFSAVTAAFPTVEAAAQAVFEIIGGGLGPSALELLDGATVAILAETGGFDMPAVPNLFMEFTGASPAALEEILALAQEICEGLGCLRFTSGMGERPATGCGAPATTSSKRSFAISRAIRICSPMRLCPFPPTRNWWPTALPRQMSWDWMWASSATQGMATCTRQSSSRRTIRRCASGPKSITTGSPATPFAWAEPAPASTGWAAAKPNIWNWNTGWARWR